jgi:dihydroorotase
MPSIENSLPLMLDAVNQGKLTLERVVAAMCDAPARVWDVVGKGRIAEGYDADLVLVDMQHEREVLSEDQLTKCGWTPWHGARLTGWPVRTWVLGRTAYRDERVESSVRGQAAEFDHARGGYWATS